MEQQIHKQQPPQSGDDKVCQGHISLLDLLYPLEYFVPLLMSAVAVVTAAAAAAVVAVTEKTLEVYKDMVKR